MASVLFRKATCTPDTLHTSMERKLIKPSELDIYYQPVELGPAVETSTSPAFLYDNVSIVRKKLTGAFSGLLTTHEKLSQLLGSFEEKVLHVYTNGLTDPYFLLTPGVVTLATVGGALVAGKGRRPFKRSFYAFFFGTTALAVSYPGRTMDIATTSYYHTSSGLSTLIYKLKNTESVTERVIKDIQLDTKEEKVEEELVSDPVDIETVIGEDSELKNETVIAELKSETKDVEITIEKDSKFETDPNEEIPIADDNATVKIELDTKQEKVLEELVSDHVNIETVIGEDSEHENETVIAEFKSETKDVEITIEMESKFETDANEEIPIADGNVTVKIDEVLPMENESELVPEDVNVISTQDELKVETVEIIKANEESDLDKDNDNIIVSESDNNNAEEPRDELKVTADYGQSSSEDNDMYSTRS